MQATSEQQKIIHLANMRQSSKQATDFIVL